MSDISPLSGISELSFDSTLLSLVRLPNAVILSVLSFFLPASPFSFFPANSAAFLFRDIGFLVWRLFSMVPI